jgi:hypothetical protein
MNIKIDKAEFDRGFENGLVKNAKIIQPQQSQIQPSPQIQNIGDKPGQSNMVNVGTELLGWKRAPLPNALLHPIDRQKAKGWNELLDKTNINTAEIPERIKSFGNAHPELRTGVTNALFPGAGDLASGLRKLKGMFAGGLDWAKNNPGMALGGLGLGLGAMSLPFLMGGHGGGQQGGQPINITMNMPGQSVRPQGVYNLQQEKLSYVLPAILATQIVSDIQANHQEAAPQQDKEHPAPIVDMVGKSRRSKKLLQDPRMREYLKRLVANADQQAEAKVNI